jgi:hypothetical protein
MPMPASLEPGDYTVSFTVGDEAVSCTTTTQVDLSLAIEGIIYSKWEDVLFVDNSDGKFTAYQWYENGSPLADQTRQYLYDPNGLPHLYFCRLTTTGGRVIYTCEIAFADATPSRTVTGSEEKPASVKMYDPAGRAVTGKPENGIYIIVEEKDGVMKARKVAVF